MFTFTEASYENSIIELFENLGYQHIYGLDLGRDENAVRILLMEDQLQNSLEMINPDVPSVAIKEAIYKIKNYETISLVAKNEIFTDYLQNGVQVSYQDAGETKGALVYLVNYEQPSMNSFIIANQWTVKEKETKRPDIVIFLNGIPVVVMELKSPMRKRRSRSTRWRKKR